MNFLESEVRTYYAIRLPQLTQRGREWRGPCPVHNGEGDNFSVNSKTGFANCHSKCGKGWDIISLDQALSGTEFPVAKREVFKLLGRTDDDLYGDRFEAEYPYHDQFGNVVFRAVRMRLGDGDKRFTQQRPHRGGWANGIKGIELVPYNLPNVLAADLVFIAEGEKSVETLRGLNLTGSCNNGGAKNFAPGIVKWFAGKHIGILPDNDQAGRGHALKVAEMLSAVAKSVRIIELPGLPEKGDIADFIQDGGTVDQVLDHYARAQDWSKDWTFSLDVPHGNDKYLRTYVQAIEDAGGFSAFWDLAATEGIPTPWSKLTDAMAGGLRNSEVYIIGANQGAGKTSLAMQFAWTALRSGIPTLILSMEMNWRDCFQRICSIEARVDLLDLRWNQKHPANSPAHFSEMRESINSVSYELAKMPLYVSNKSSVSPEFIVSEATRLKKRDGIGLVIVDHMQLMSADAKVRGDVEKFTDISRATKRAAMECNLPVLLVSQTSRSNSADKRTELEVSDLRGSGAIEEDAATVLLLYHDKDDRDRTTANQTFSKGPVKTWLKIGKNRYGLQHMYMPLMHFKTCTRFDPFEYHPEAA
jgi:KaiC/GvpD/RAD55 family RecA-like ATPase